MKFTENYRHLTYLDNAATTFPKPARVYDEITRCMRRSCGNPGRSAHPLARAADEIVFNTRTAAAGLFGVKNPENVVFTLNATDAINKVLRGLIRGGERILMSNIEHNSVYRAVVNLCKETHSRFDTFSAEKDDGTLLYELEEKLRGGADIVICLHASNICSRVLPARKIGALCERFGVPFILDASQSAGIYDINLRRDNISALCVPGHKGLYGPQGTGMCVFDDRFDFDRLSPCVFGGNGTRSAEITMGNEPPESYEAGTVNVPGIAGLGEGIRYVKKIGSKRILSHEKALFVKALDALERLRATVYLPEWHGGVLLFNFRGMSASDISARLGESGVCTRAGLHCAPLIHKHLNTFPDGLLRASFSVQNTNSEASCFIRAIKKIAKC